MRDGWRGGRRDGTVCGGGSTLENTKNIRSWLPDVLHRYGFRSVCDAGAGDLHWARGLFDGIDYRPFDLVPRSPEVTELDITKEALPKCDVILCRAVLIHLDPPRIVRALRLFRESSDYLLATTEPSDNAFDPELQCNPLDMTTFLGEPIDSVPDLEGPHSRLALWVL
jgi:hypothetical protein